MKSDLVDRFCEVIKKDYPDLPIKEIKLICMEPFKFARSCISNGTLMDFQLKYLGTFSPSYRRISDMMKRLKYRYDNGLIDEKFYNSYKEPLEKFQKKYNCPEKFYNRKKND